MHKAKLKITTFLTSYDNNSGWRLDDDGHVVMKDGNPVYVDGSGREMTVDQSTISKLNGEAKAHREAKEAVEAKLKKFEGLDPEKAREALEIASKIDAKKLIDAGKVDELKNQITQEFQTKMSEKDKLANELQARLDGMQINAVFSNSEFIRNNVAVPHDMFEAFFRNNFKVEEGKVIVYGKDGNRLMSKSKVGEYADPEEAFQILTESHSQKDVILRADVGSGSGSEGGGGNRGGGRVIKRAEFDKMPPMQQSATMKKVNAGEMKLTD